MTRRRLETAGAALASVWLLAFLVADVLISDSDVAVGVLTAVSPLIACAVLPPRWTACFAVAATTLTAASGVWNDSFGMLQHYVRVFDVLVVGGAAVIIAEVRVRSERRILRLVAIADVAQRAVLPVVPPRVGGLRMATRYASAAEEALVGGDFYDLFHSDAGVRVLIGDVCGKGLDGVQHAARVIRAFRQSAAALPDLVAVAKQMNDYLLPFFGDEDFVTALLVEFSVDGTLTLVDCGHHPPLLVSDGRATEVERAQGQPLGVATSFKATTRRRHPHDRLLLYTDGLVEARDDNGQFLPPETIVGCLRLADPDAALDALLAALEAHVPRGRLTDDLALVLVDDAG